VTDIRYNVLKIVNDRAPNYVSEWVILRRLQRYPREEVRKILETLADKEEILIKEVDAHPTTGEPETLYRLKDIGGVPLRKTIMIGDTPVRRLLSDSNPRFLPETVNEHTEAVAEYSAKLESRFKELIKKEQRRYWANVVGVMGLMISLLAIIIVGLPKIETDPSLAWWDVFSMNLAQLLPLVVVLILLVVALRWVVR
jgi:hypothetical protein